MVNPSKEQQDTYNFLTELEDEILKALQDGIKLSEVYNAALLYTEKNRKELVEKMTKNVGLVLNFFRLYMIIIWNCYSRFAMGIEFRESSLLITSKCNVTAKKGMVFNICVGFSGLENKDAKDDPLAKIYALFIGDTVVVNEVT